MVFPDSSTNEYSVYSEPEFEHRRHRTDRATIPRDGTRKRDAARRSGGAGHVGKGGSVLGRCGNAISNSMERAFFWWANLVATYPVLFMVGCVGFVAASASGILRLKMEDRTHVLWLPVNSVAAKEAELSAKHFPNSARLERVVTIAPNVLTADVIKAMFKLDQNIKSLNNGTDSQWNSVCVRLGPKCWISSLLEVWNYDNARISTLTDATVLTDVNAVTLSPYQGTPFNVSNYLGGVVRDAGGKIISATSSVHSYYTNNDETEVDNEMIYITKVLAFEEEFINLLMKGHKGIEKVLFYAQRSYNDLFTDRSVTEAQLLLGVGYGLMMIFVVITIGKFNRLEHMVYMTGGGLLVVSMSLAACLGLGTYVGYFFGPLHNLLALLILGVGVDDMFVIMHALDHLPPEVRAEAPPAEQVALALRHAGVSITVTSLTDVAAFCVGGSTILPALRSFCIYCGIGLLVMYLLLITFFVAILSIDRGRVMRRRDACLCCLVLDNEWTPSECSRKSVLSAIFKKFYGPFIVHPASKCVVILVACGLLAGGIFGVINLEVRTELSRLFPAGSYAQVYLRYVLREYPSNGLETAVHFIDVDYFGKKAVLDNLHKTLDEAHYVQRDSVDSWYLRYKKWLTSYPGLSQHLQPASDGEMFPKDEDTFYMLLEIFLEDEGKRYVGSAITMYTTPESKHRINASRLIMRQSFTNTTSGEINAMRELHEITASTQLGAENCFPYSFNYPLVEANRLLNVELLRNLGLAFACVAVVTLLLIASLVTCLTVLITVILTVVDVAGGMYYLGINIDIVSSITLILTIGLSIDYSAHIGHTFMTVTGSKNDRVRTTLETIGSAVFLGGFSTFLAISPLLFAKSFVLNTFSQIFAAVVVVGLFHGLALLPVMLSLIGPSPYNDSSHDRKKETRPIQREVPRDQKMDRGRSRNEYEHSRRRSPSRRYSAPPRQKTKIFYVHPALEHPVPCYNGRPAVRPPSSRIYRHSAMMYGERDRPSHRQSTHPNTYY